MVKIGKDDPQTKPTTSKHKGTKRTRDTKPTASKQTTTKCTRTDHAEAAAAAAAFRSLHKMEIIGQGELGSYEAPFPVLDLEAAPFDPRLIAKLLDCGFTKPTPIQAQAWPICLAGRDIISIARTGSGKTLAFLLPTLQRILTLQSDPQQKTKGEVLALVLAPTRELAIQIEAVAAPFGEAVEVYSACVFGGAPKEGQLRKLARVAKQPSLIIATPGRLADFCNGGEVSLESVKILVLDEADRMLDMGFEPQLEALRWYISGDDDAHNDTERQTLLFSATWPRSVKAIAGRFTTKPVQLNVGDSSQLVANESVNQRTILMKSWHKFEHLEQVIKDIHAEGVAAKGGDPPKTIVFFNSKWECDKTCNAMWHGGLKCDALHGNKNQSKRSRVMAEFTRGSINTLFATDVAARGLDVKDVTHVINYDFPAPMGKAGIEDFVHRIGRTGRAGRGGSAITFFTDGDRAHAPALCALLVAAQQQVPQELQDMAPKSVKFGVPQELQDMAPKSVKF